MTIEEIKNRIYYGSFNPINNQIDYEARLTMLPLEVLDNVEYCIKECIKNNIEGDFVETGIWRGGACILAREIFKSLNINKKIYAYDSFEGLPKPDAENYPIDTNDIHWSIPELSVSLEKVQENFKLFRELDDDILLIKGWFKDTIPLNKIDKICILRLDGDMYESTIQVLNTLYDKLSPGGFCIIDDWGPMHGAKQATLDFREKHNIISPLIHIDNPSCPSVYWIK